MDNSEVVAAFARETQYDDLSEDTAEAIKKRVLDSIGIAVGAIGAEPVDIVHETVSQTGASDAASIWGEDEKASLDQAAMMNTTLTRYLDYMDSFLAPGETPHPSDNIATAIVCGEHADRSGADLIAAIGVAYEIQAALAWNAPVRDRGWDHVTHTIFSATAAAASMLGLDHEQTQNALGIAGTAHNALRVTRTGDITMWKGIASANTARNAVYSTMLAANGMEGPTDIFDGEKGWKHIVSGDFEAELDPGCSAVHKTMHKRYVAETYAQSALEGLFELIDEQDIEGEEIASIHLETFHGAYQIIGGGAGGDRYTVKTKEQADHSLPYMLAVAALDGQMLNEQYAHERIHRNDVQELLKQVTIEEDEELTALFEQGHMPARMTIKTNDGAAFTVEKQEFQGHPNNPATWEQIEDKFRLLAEDYYGRDGCDVIIDCVKSLEEHDVSDLVALLGTPQWEQT